MSWLVALESFHFIRPGWLMILPIVGFLCLLYYRQRSMSWRWRQHIPEHLLKYLLLSSPSTSIINPQSLSLVLMFISVLSVAGPSWQKIPSPFTSDEAPLVIVLKLSESMLADDVQPSRLDLAKLKISDVLAQRAKAPTALVVYAGTAHTVLPLTNDPVVLNYYLEDLNPDVMPNKGDDTLAAIRLGQSLLHAKTNNSDITQSLGGSILLLTDGVNEVERDSIAVEIKQQSIDLLMLLIGTTDGLVSQELTRSLPQQSFMVDKLSITEWAVASAINVVDYSVDHSDVETIDRLVQQHFQAVQPQDQQQQDADAGYYLLWPLIALMLLWFRRGMVMQWH